MVLLYVPGSADLAHAVLMRLPASPPTDTAGRYFGDAGSRLDEEVRKMIPTNIETIMSLYTLFTTPYMPI